LPPVETTSSPRLFLITRPPSGGNDGEPDFVAHDFGFEDGRGCNLQGFANPAWKHQPAKSIHGNDIIHR
jgi:hypothetical protein